jgi:hypothetical protein
MRRYHLVIVTALVGAIAACLMIRTPDASASSESVTYIPAQAEARPSLIVAQTEAPEADAPAVENSAPPDDPVLNEALAQEQKPEAAAKEEAPAEKPAKPMKAAFAQSSKTSRKAAGVKSKKSSKSKAKKTAKHPKKKKKKAKKA